MKQRRHRQKLQKAQNNAHERRTAYPTPLKAHPRIGIGRESECHFPSFRFLSFYFHFLSMSTLSFPASLSVAYHRLCSLRFAVFALPFARTTASVIPNAGCGGRNLSFFSSPPSRFVRVFLRSSPRSLFSLLLTLGQQTQRHKGGVLRREYLFAAVSVILLVL